jgi:hypothetical protein
MAGGLAIAGLFSLRLAKAEASEALADLAGNYGGEQSATFAVCFNSTFSAVAPCATAPNTAFFTQTDVHQGAVDASGNSCTTGTITNGPEFPSAPPKPANVSTLISVGKVTSYNATTESGKVTVAVYTAGTGTFCNGSVFVNPAGAPVVGNVTLSFVVSQGWATRIDAVYLSAQNSPVADLADYVGHAVSFKQ